MKNDIVAIVVTYNRKMMLFECLRHLAEQTVQDFDIIVVDNASTDGTGQDLAPFVETGKIIYLNPGENLGGAGGFLFGIKQAAERGYRYFWLMDDDTLPYPDALEQFLVADRALDGKYGFLSGKALWTDGKLCRMNLQKKDVFHRLKNRDGSLIPIGVATFVSMFTKAEIVQDVGLPIPEFFIWTDDVEYTDRISAKYPCYLVSKSCVTHAMSSNIGVNLASEGSERLERYRYCYRNEVYVYRRHGIKGAFYLLLKDFYHATRILLFSEGWRWKKLRVLCLGIREDFSFRPGIPYLRSHTDE